MCMGCMGMTQHHCLACMSTWEGSDIGACHVSYPWALSLALDALSGNVEVVTQA